MPIFEFKCKDCGKTCELIVFGSEDTPTCSFCNSPHLEKLLSAHAAVSGLVKHTMPGLGDTGCCGSTPGQAPNCAGPGSCCGRNMD
ncbi:MAG: zinc ribbon domain-containing protein [Proteobacteria bacterium]|nr:zinc ribbon domain-containing protein [Desulfobacula sp.]MBU4133600.1 zinc ribbon domain-containing protein [Pseudomonadota bacterium]